MAPVDDTSRAESVAAPGPVDLHPGHRASASAGDQAPPLRAGAEPEDGRPDDEEARRLRAARRHELGRPPVTAHEIGDRTYRVAEVEPLDVDGVRTMQVGSLMWLLALVALLPFMDTLRASGRDWWLVTCLAGTALGLVGWEYCRRRRTAILADPRRRMTDNSELGPLG